MKKIIKLLRPHQWIKNLLVLLPMATLGTPNAQGVAIAFLAFCLMSSCVYVLNDIKDAPSDRLHPEKRLRPIASGLIPPPVAASIGIGLLLGSLLIAGRFAPSIIPFLVAYAALNLAYSQGLKHLALVDSACISTGFVLRLLSGSAAAATAPSAQLAICVFFGTFALSNAKRLVELKSNPQAALTRPSLSGLTEPALNVIIGTSLAMAFLNYSLWAQSFGFWYALSILPIAYAAFLAVSQANMGQGEDLSSEILKNRKYLVAILMWAVVLGFARYFSHWR